jgi:cytochrome c553
MERSSIVFGLGLMLLMPVCVGSAPAEQGAAVAAAWQYDPENAQEILDTCAACHGKNGAGGKGGEYPRVAGLDEQYIIKQVSAFKARERVNIPMYPYATERELPPDDIRDIARLLSEIELPTRMPKLDESASAYERLLAAQSVFNVPRVEGGNIERGARLFEDECADCHGEEGWGDGEVPQLAGQHTNYLRRQIESFRSGERANEDMEGVFEGIDAQDLEDIFAFLASRDD